MDIFLTLVYAFSVVSNSSSTNSNTPAAEGLGAETTTEATSNSGMVVHF